MSLRSFFVFSALLLLVSCSDQDPAAALKSANNKGAAPSTPLVEIQVVKETTINNMLYATGTILANEEVELRSETNGRITGIYFAEGSLVKEGQQLVKIDDSELRAQLQKINTQIELAKTEQKRQQRLLEIEAVSQGEYDIVANKLQTLEADRSLIAAQLAKTQIKAPFSGVIGLRNVSNGSFVSPDTRIALLQQLDPVKVDFSIPEKYSTEIKQGAEVRFTISGSQKTYSGKVFANDLAVDPSTRTIKLRARSVNPKRELIPGTFAKIELNLGVVKNTVMLPAQAIIPELNGQKVFVLEKGLVKSNPVEIGLRTEDMVQVTGGLQKGDTVITSGILQLKDGIPVSFNQKGEGGL